MLQDSLDLTPQQREEIVRLRATSLAKQADNQAQWHQICTAIAQVTSAAHRHLYTPIFPHHCACLLLLSARKPVLAVLLRLLCYLQQALFVSGCLLLLNSRAFTTAGPAEIEDTIM